MIRLMASRSDAICSSSIPSNRCIDSRCHTRTFSRDGPAPAPAPTTATRSGTAPGRVHRRVPCEVAPPEPEVEVLDLRDEHDGLDEEDEGVGLVRWVREEGGWVVRPLAVGEGDVDLCGRG